MAYLAWNIMEWPPCYLVVVGSDERSHAKRYQIDGKSISRHMRSVVA